MSVLGGFSSWVLVDRGMDLGQVWADGRPLAWLSPVGVMNPAQADDGRWLRGFGGGLLATAGLTNVGASCHWEGEEQGVHGRLSTRSATDVHVTRLVLDDGPVLRVQGDLRESSALGADLRLTRRLDFFVGTPRLDIHDEVTNLGWRPAPVQVLYHVNLGHPLLGPDATMGLCSESAEPLLEPRPSKADAWRTFGPPDSMSTSQVYEHRLAPKDPADPDVREVEVRRRVGESDVSLRIAWLASQLPQFRQWQMFAPGNYVLGLEPTNCSGNGVAQDVQDGTAEWLEARRTLSFDLSVRLRATPAARAKSRT